jgi:hypothetical protein
MVMVLLVVEGYTQSGALLAECSCPGGLQRRGRQRPHNSPSSPLAMEAQRTGFREFRAAAGPLLQRLGPPDRWTSAQGEFR